MAKERKTSKRTVTEYFREEHDYLLRRGRAFAREFKRLMPFFHEYERYPDPHVDRILEGVAFLTAKLNRAFDENKGHLAMQFLRVFWPQFLRPVPSAALVEFKPRPTMSLPFPVEQGYELESRNLVRTDRGTRTVFQVKYSTSEAITVNPLNVESVKLERSAAGFFLRIAFRTVRGVSLGDLDFDRPFRLQLMAADVYELYNAYEDLRYRCSQGLSGVTLRCPVDGPELPRKIAVRFPDPLLLPPLFPHQPTVFPGFRALQEFFILPERFLVFELDGIAAVNDYKEEDSFELLVPFNRGERNILEWKTGNLRLHCAPVVNLFSGPCKVQMYTGESRRLPLDAGDFPNADGCSLYHVRDAMMRNYSDSTRTILKECDFSRFGALDATDELGAEPSYSLDFEFTESVSGPTRSGSGQTEGAGEGTLIRNLFLILRDAPTPRNLSEAYTITAEAVWCNHDINTSLNQIHISQGAPEPVMCENLFAPTRFIAPREPSVWQWRLVDLMSLNYLSIQTIDGFRKMLEIFMADTSADNKIFLNCLLDLKVEKKQFWENRIPVNGLRFTFRVADDLFQSKKGQMLAFFDLIHSFLTHYVSINSKVELRVILNDSGDKELDHWPARRGGRVAL